MKLETDKGKKVTLGEFVGKGGEGKVYRVRNRYANAVKLYDVPTKKQENKIRFLAAFPEDMRPSSSVAAWPLEPVYEVMGYWPWKKSVFVGYTMPFVTAAYPIFCFYTPKERKERKWKFTGHNKYTLALNLATAFAQFHNHNLVIGDVNCKNILVTEQLAPTFIDIDSIQISSSYTTDVGFEEYTPPELAGQSLKSVVRNKHHDLFGLGYLIFQLLMDGCSPFAGIANVELKWEHVDTNCKAHGIFPFYPNEYVAPPPGMPSIAVFEPEVAEGFIACFIKGRRNPEIRPDASAWQDKLMKAIPNLRRCNREPSHSYSSHLSYCPWCE